jgi:protein SCO1/2
MAGLRLIKNYIRLLSGFFLLLVGLPLCQIEIPLGAQNIKPPLLQNVGVDQRLNARVPLDIPFRDEAGRTVMLREFFKKKPVILTPVYYECPMLCNQILNGLTGSLKALAFTAGKEFEIVTVSFNPQEGPSLASAKKENYVADYRRPEAAAGWHFLTGEPRSIAALTNSVGFRYAWDSSTGQYAHAAAIILLTPEGQVSRYFYGIDFSPKDLRLGLIEASQNKIGTLADQVMLYCYHYDPTSGKYGLAILNLIRLAGALTVGGILLLIFVVLRRQGLPRRLRAEGAN